MTGTQILSAIIEILVSGITNIARGLGQGVSNIVEYMFLTTNTETGAITGLSTFGILIITFAGISLALGLCRLIYQFLTSLGAKNQ